MTMLFCIAESEIKVIHTYILCSIHHGRFYSRLVHFVFQLCWYVPVAHHPSSSLHFDQAIFTLLFTSFSAPPLALNIEPRYLM